MDIVTSRSPRWRGSSALQLLTGGFNLIAGIHAPAEALAELTSPAGR